MIILRALLVGLLTVAFSATAWARCCVGLSFEAALSHAAMDHHSSMDHDAQGDCGSSEPRACDAMVQATAPQAPAVAPLLVSHGVFPIVVTGALSHPVLFAVRRTDRPPDRTRRFRDFYARTGRLLV